MVKRGIKFVDGSSFRKKIKRQRQKQPPESNHTTRHDATAGTAGNVSIGESNDSIGESSTLAIVEGHSSQPAEGVDTEFTIVSRTMTSGPIIHSSQPTKTVNTTAPSTSVPQSAHTPRRPVRNAVPRKRDTKDFLSNYGKAILVKILPSTYIVQDLRADGRLQV